MQYILESENLSLFSIRNKSHGQMKVTKVSDRYLHLGGGGGGGHRSEVSRPSSLALVQVELQEWQLWMCISRGNDGLVQLEDKAEILPAYMNTWKWWSNFHLSDKRKHKTLNF